MNLLQFELLLLKKFEKINFSIKKKISLLKIIIIRLRYLIMIDIFIEHVIWKISNQTIKKWSFYSKKRIRINSIWNWKPKNENLRFK